MGIEKGCVGKFNGGMSGATTSGSCCFRNILREGDILSDNPLGLRVELFNEKGVDVLLFEWG